MGDVNLEIKLSNLDERVIKIEESGGSGGDGYITSVSNDFKDIKINASDISDNREGLTETFETTLVNTDDVAINRQAIEELYELITAESEVK